MNNPDCSKSNCFYYAKGQCTSITAMGEENCAQFRSKHQARMRTLPRRLDLAMTRWHLDQAFNAKQKIVPANSRASSCVLKNDQALYATG